MHDTHAWYYVPTMHELLHENSKLRRPLYPIIVVLLVFSLITLGCKGRRAERFKRLRKDFPDSFRVALVNVVDPMSNLSSRDQRRLDDDFQKELLRCPEFRVTDPATLKAFLRQKRLNASLSALSGEEIEEIGEALDLEAFLVPKVTAPPSANRVSLGVDLYNGYTGDVFWSRERTERTRSRRDRQNGYKRAFERIVDELRDELSSLVSKQKALKRAATQSIRKPTPKPTESVKQSPPPTPTTVELHEDQLPIPVPTETVVKPSQTTPSALRLAPIRFNQQNTAAQQTQRPVKPSYGAGAEQLSFEAKDFQRLTPLPNQGPLKSAVITYGHRSNPGAIRLVVKVHDLDSPKEARRFLDDHFNGASPQWLAACRTYAMRDSLDGRLAVGALLGKFVLISEAAKGQESLISSLTKQLLQANKTLASYYRRNPSPPAAKPIVRVINKPQPKEKVIREVRYQIRKVEIPQTIVPKVEIHLDRQTLLTLVRDELKSTDDKVVMRLENTVQKAPKPTKGPAPTTKPPVVTKTPPVTKKPAPKPKIPDGTETENSAAMLRYNLGCRYMATSRFKKAEEEFHKALKLDNEYEAPRYQLRQIKEQFGIDVYIPPLKPTPPPTPTKLTTKPVVTQKPSPTSKATPTASPTQVATNQGTKASIATTASQSANETTATTAPQRRRNRARGNTVLLVGVFIAIGIIVIKLLFLSDPED